jgi:H+/Cl- antiporter ClcA
VISSSELEQRHWSPFSYIWNIFGSWFSHLAGASLGREGTVLVLASSLAQIGKLNWNYYKSIVISAAFAGVVGQPFIALIIIIEMFSTSAQQKVFSFVMAWVGFLVMQSLGIHPLFSMIQVDLSAGFTDKFLVAFLIGLFLGFMANAFKYGYGYLSVFFKKNKMASVMVVLLLSWIFIQPEMKSLQSLSLDSFSEIQNGKANMQFVLLKSIFTLLFVSLGFIGGDFVPSIAIGSGFGVLVANYFQVNYTFGLAMGLMAFFTGLTRLKWTSLGLLFLLAGFKVMLWGYLCLSITRQMSGLQSLYKKDIS